MLTWLVAPADADLLGLQEVWAVDGSNLAAGLAEEFSMHWAWSPSPRVNTAGCGLPAPRSARRS